MLPYTKVLKKLIKTGNIKGNCTSDVWYEERTDWSGEVQLVLKEQNMK